MYMLIVSEPMAVVFTRPLHGHVELSVGQRHELICVAEGLPEPQYAWLRDGRVVDRDDGFPVSNSTRFVLLTSVAVVVSSVSSSSSASSSGRSMQVAVV